MRHLVHAVLFHSSPCISDLYSAEFTLGYLQVAVFDRGKPPSLQPSSVHPFLTIPHIDASTTLPSQPPLSKGPMTKGPMTKGLHLDPSTAQAPQPQQFVVNLPSVVLSATPRQLATLRSVISWGTGEMNHILGKEPMAPLEPEEARRQSFGESPARVAGRGTPGVTSSAPRRSPNAVPDGPRRRAGRVDANVSSPDRVAPGGDRLAPDKVAAGVNRVVDAPMTDDSALLGVAVPGSTPERDGPSQRLFPAGPSTSHEDAATVVRELGTTHDGFGEDAKLEAVPNGQMEANPVEGNPLKHRQEARGALERRGEKRPWRLLGDLSTVALHLLASDGAAATLALFCSGLSCDVGRNADGGDPKSPKGH